MKVPYVIKVEFPSWHFPRKEQFPETLRIAASFWVGFLTLCGVIYIGFIGITGIMYLAPRIAQTHPSRHTQTLDPNRLVCTAAHDEAYKDDHGDQRLRVNCTAYAPASTLPAGTTDARSNPSPVPSASPTG